MSNLLHTIPVNHLVKETKDATTIYLDIPENLEESFKYLPGQYLTFEVSINGETLRRAYSLCSSPHANEKHAVTVKKVDDGRVSAFMNDELKDTDSLQVLPPNGKFTIEVAENNSKHYALFAGGSGITPMMSILKSVLHQEPYSRVSLIYANRDVDSVIFKSEIDRLNREFPERLQVHYSYDKAPTNWFGLQGYITEEKMKGILNNNVGETYHGAHYYICGPGPLMDAVKTGLSRNGVDDKRVHTEYFTGANADDVEATEVGSDSEEVFTGVAQVKVDVYGDLGTVTVRENQTILDVANDEGLNPPFSCTIGVCTTCRAKLVTGKVEMNETEGLSQQELDEGYILTCQSHPKSNNIEVIYE